jgi:hypothetical protein
MKKAAWSILLVSLLALGFCSKSGKSKDGSPVKPPVAMHEKNEPRAVQSAPEPSPLLIASVVLSPETPTVLDDIRAAAELADPDVQGVEFRYQWFVNGQEIAELDSERLASTYFRKGAWIYCQAKAFSTTEEGEWRKSDTIRVLNSLPTLQLGPVGAVRVPGELRYQATASDPDQDELTFEVLSPLEQGIAIDPRSGLLTWQLSEETVRTLGEKIEIRIAVSDGEGEKVTGTITLQFTSTTNKTT